MKKKDLYLIPSRQNDNQIEWIWAYDGEFGTVQDFPVIDLPKDTGKHQITFSIIDPQNQIVFDNTSIQGPQGPYQNAIWIMEKQSGGNKLPGVQKNDQIDDIKLQKGDTQLTLKDKNLGDAMEFVYQLNFKNSQTNQPVTAIDPDLKNGGGGQPSVYSAMETTAIALGVAVIAALLAVVAQRLTIQRH